MTPVTPVRKPLTSPDHQSSPATPPTATSPIPYTPSLLSRFLRYSQDHLGVHDAVSYEDTLLRHGYGPDILHKVPSKGLENLGVSTDDVIRLKDASLPWFSGPHAKRRRSGDSDEAGAQRTSSPKKGVVSYERRWFTADGNSDGMSRFYGGLMEKGDRPEVEADGTWMEVWYFCEARNDWVQVLLGFVVVEDAEPF